MACWVKDLLDNIIHLTYNIMIYYILDKALITLYFEPNIHIKNFKEINKSALIPTKVYDKALYCLIIKLTYLMII